MCYPLWGWAKPFNLYAQKCLLKILFTADSSGQNRPKPTRKEKTLVTDFDLQTT